jgi:hypothetical protein
VWLAGFLCGFFIAANVALHRNHKRDDQIERDRAAFIRRYSGPAD